MQYKIRDWHTVSAYKPLKPLKMYILFMCLKQIPTDLFSVSIILFFPKCHKNGIIKYEVFQTGSFHVTICIYDSLVVLHGLIAYSFRSLTGIPWIGTVVCLSPCEGHLGCFKVLAIMNKVVKSISMQIFVWTLHLFLKLKLAYIFIFSSCHLILVSSTY